ncbi:hypothetical protein HMPREF9336_04204 [Segniliparus rugosus ATCC BAA-974]|uniref:Uncharacterized protein n=1 Tax=Segniliparus rugosus (strain ATCC BAA-974 / DSM 45345 / CCUG 50838 / CIP 108380 / JCM 13579 / CDC 945) TaxID=679197 RepID=U1N926_SEGRC|nr:hypothetical protein HMPREF9336_04204 [Segniliparus rugosus ATCC BAA-974]
MTLPSLRISMKPGFSFVGLRPPLATTRESVMPGKGKPTNRPPSSETLFLVNQEKTLGPISLCP